MVCGQNEVPYTDFVVDSDVYDHLLKMTTDLFVTIRGFSYVSEWMENYKQAHKKCCERFKSLHKRLYTDSTDYYFLCCRLSLYILYNIMFIVVY